MTLGLISGVVGAAAGVTAGVAGAALHVGSQVLETAANIADAVCIELAHFAVAEHCKIAGPSFKLQGIVSGTITVGPEGKTYRLVLKCEAYINGFWAAKTFLAEVFVPWIGLPNLRVFESIEVN